MRQYATLRLAEQYQVPGYRYRRYSAAALGGKCPAISSNCESAVTSPLQLSLGRGGRRYPAVVDAEQIVGRGNSANRLGARGRKLGFGKRPRERHALRY